MLGGMALTKHLCDDGDRSVGGQGVTKNTEHKAQVSAQRKRAWWNRWCPLEAVQQLKRCPLFLPDVHAELACSVGHLQLHNGVGHYHDFGHTGDGKWVAVPAVSSSAFARELCRTLRWPWGQLYASGRRPWPWRDEMKFVLCLVFWLPWLDEPCERLCNTSGRRPSRTPVQWDEWRRISGASRRRRAPCSAAFGVRAAGWWDDHDVWCNASSRRGWHCSRLGAGYAQVEISLWWPEWRKGDSQWSVCRSLSSGHTKDSLRTAQCKARLHENSHFTYAVQQERCREISLCTYSFRAKPHVHSVENLVDVFVQYTVRKKASNTLALRRYVFILIV